jgi:MFS family permease
MIVSTIKRFFQKTFGFVSHQPRNFKTMLIRRSLHGVSVNLSVQFNSIYATKLGADPVQLGSLQSAGNAIGALVSIPADWLIERYGLKKIFLLSTILLTGSAILYFFAPKWIYLYAAVILFYVGNRITCIACTVTGANELSNEQRATGRGLCRTISSIATLVTPLLGAWIVSISGGVNAKGIRPLYAVQGIAFILVMVLIAVFFQDKTRLKKIEKQEHVFTQFIHVLKQGPEIIRMMFMIALMEIPWSMVQPFMPLFAHQLKGADEFVLGGMVVAISIAPILFSIPLGRLADRYGRKILLYAITPLSWASNLLLIFAMGRNMLILSGMFFGFNNIAIGIALAMTSEIVSKKQMGHWISIVSLTRGLMSIPVPMLGGFIWNHIGPHYVFIAAILIDVAVRLPLLASIRETLNIRIKEDIHTD